MIISFKRQTNLLTDLFASRQKIASLCSHCRKMATRRTLRFKYLPYLVSVTLMKLTVLTLIASQRNQQRTLSLRPGNFSLDLAAGSAAGAADRTPGDGGSSSRLSGHDLTRYWQLLNDLQNADVSPSATNRTSASSIWLIYNRIPRSGGLTMVYLIRELAQMNHFTHQKHQYRTPWNRLLIDEEQKNLVTWFEYQHLAKSYDRHFLHVNFSKYQRYTRNLKPTYINVLRDPIEREYSAFRGRREDPYQVSIEMKKRDAVLPGSGIDWYSKDFADCVLEDDPECAANSTDHVFIRSIPYFCGQHADCLVSGSRWALQRAKFIVEYEYSVVGILNQMNETLQVLENYVPRFFAGASQLYYRAGYARRHENRYFKAKPALSEQVMSKLKDVLQAEYELYEFCKQRLHLQYRHITTGDN